jgi:hypothetical protein
MSNGNLYLKNNPPTPPPGDYVRPIWGGWVMELSKSKLLSSLFLVLALASPGGSLGQAPASKLPIVILSPVQRLPTDSDRVIRDFVQLLYPDWNNAAWDLVITGKRSMNPNFGVDSWSFAVLDMSQYALSGFPPSAIPCNGSVPCFSYPDVARARLLGRIYQGGIHVYAFVGARPEITKENADLQQTLHPDSSPQDVQDRLAAAGAHYPPSSESELRKHLEAEPLFVKYGFHIRSLQFCRSIGPSDRKTIAMFWSARVFSSTSHQQYRVTLEPFGADITGLLAVSKGEAAELACAQ